MKILALSLTLLIFASCKNTEQEQDLAAKKMEQNLRSNELVQEANSRQAQISTKEAVNLAEVKFAAYLPTILEDHQAILDVQQSYTGDFTGDGVPDVAIFFTLAPRGGGNAIIDQGLSLYKNTLSGVEVIAGFEPDYLFSVDTIKDGKIHITHHEYAENDGRCCPSIHIPHTLTIKGNKAF